MRSWRDNANIISSVFKAYSGPINQYIHLPQRISRDKKSTNKSCKLIFSFSIFAPLIHFYSNGSNDQGSKNEGRRISRYGSNEFDKKRTNLLIKIKTKKSTSFARSGRIARV